MTIPQSHIGLWNCRSKVITCRITAEIRELAAALLTLGREQIRLDEVVAELAVGVVLLQHGFEFCQACVLGL
jgi:hypothetical protein